MERGQGEPALNYPISNDAALDPPQEWAELRAECPVARVTLPSGDHASLLSRYQDVKEALADPRFTRSLTAPDAARISESGGAFNSSTSKSIPHTGDAHLRWRRMVSKWFTAKRMNSLRPEIEAMADQLIDGMIERDQPADLKSNLGFPLPVWVICNLLGVPDSDRDKFAYWSDNMLNLNRYGQEEIDAANAEFDDYMAGHVIAKRADPRDDLLSELITGTDAQGERLSDDTLVGTGRGLLVAGHETTANMIAKMVAMLLADRSRWEALLADPTLVRTAVEEVLRFDANSGFGLPRYIPEEAKVNDHLLEQGTTVVCNMAAANRDGTTFEGADEMDLGRSPNTHLAFGSGVHSCLGQALARTELQTVLEVLLRRLPSLELAVPVEQLQRLTGLLVGGLRELPVRW